MITENESSPAGKNEVDYLTDLIEIKGKSTFSVKKNQKHSTRKADTLTLAPPKKITITL